MKRGDLYSADLSPVVGSEQGGTRPVLIIQNNVGNEHSGTTIVAPISAAMKKHQLPTHLVVQFHGLKCKSTILFEQIRTIDKSRLEDKIGCLDDVNFDRPLMVSLGLKEGRK